MTGHTPGPWFVGELLLDDNGISKTMTIGDFSAADHYEDTICEVWDGNHDAKGNARLIAVAPELLDTLENLIIGIGMGWDLEGITDTASAVIAKATGEAS